jgi:amidohydrolase
MALTREELRARVLTTIDERREWIVAIAKRILDRPEAGFQEVETTGLVSRTLDELAIPHERGLALTGLKATLAGGRPGPGVAVIGELDALRVPDHPKADRQTGAAHACGHHGQIGMLLGVAAALRAAGVLEALSGRVCLMAVPAEELIDVEYRLGLRQAGRLDLLAGKQELIRLGAFDDVDLAMMVHTSSLAEDRRLAVGGTSNGHVAKFVRFVGKAAHSGSRPHDGVNALQAAIVALHAIDAQRDTFREQDLVRIHGILTRGGVAVNSVPAEARWEGRVRALTAEAIAAADGKVDRCLKAGALALGATVHIQTIPGYLPMRNDPALQAVFRRNAAALVGEANVATHPPDRSRGGSTDMGDLSQLIPVVHPYAGGAVGTGHGNDYLIEDYEAAVITPTKTLALTVVDLLADDAAEARAVLAAHTPVLTRAQYLRLQAERSRDEVFSGLPT